MIENSGEGAGNDQADVGSASFERDQEMVIVNNARDMLEQSQHALERIADGTLRPVRELRQRHRQEPADGLPARHAVPDLQAARGASLIASETSGDPTDRRIGRATAPPPWAVRARPRLRRRGRRRSRSTSHQAPRRPRARPAASPSRWSARSSQLTLVRNPGAAFSTGTSFTPVISVIAIVAAVVVRRHSLRVRHRGWAVALGPAAGRRAGNLTDRLLRDPGPAARPRRRLLRAAELAGLQRRRHLHQRGGRLLRDPAAPWRPPRRHPSRGAPRDEP